MTTYAWGKTNQAAVPTTYHPLVHHSMDVAAVFLRMLSLPVVSERIGAAAGQPLADHDIQRLAALAFLHDIGKLHPGFQAKGRAEGSYAGRKRGHVHESWAFASLAYEFPEHPFHRTMTLISEWGDAAYPLLRAMFSHHGRPIDGEGDPTLRGWDSPCLENYDWRTEAQRMDSALRRWFANAFDPDAPALPEAPAFHHAVAGYAALADWIGSNPRFFRFVPSLDETYDEIAKDQAEKALAAIGMDPSAWLGDFAAPSFTELTGFREPNPAQAVVGAVADDAQLVVLEAETGSGKTEAALWRFMQLLAAGKVSSLYFAVPTRAAARQLHNRIQQALDRVLPAGADAVLAVPGTIKAGEYEGKRLPDWTVLWDDVPADASSRWAAEHATRFLAAFVAVGTVDQAMLATLQVKHAHLRGSALARALLVIDEVHASDTYMTEVLTRLLDDHLAVGGYAMLMSATLGASARSMWIGEPLPDLRHSRETAYPAVWVKGEPSPRITAGLDRAKTVRIDAIPTMDAEPAAQLAVQAAQQGARVLVVRNTVTAAIETWQSIRESGAGRLLMCAAGGPALHHARFAAEDRALLDSAVEDVLGKRAAGGRRAGVIVVGTQTLEQSLDIDADMLITDLCPVDVLLQRIGRLHRHTLPRPKDYETPRALVLVPEGGLDGFVAPKFSNGVGAWSLSGGGLGGIYMDLACLELTQRLIGENPEWRIPDMNRELVEGATHPECIARLLDEKGDRWARYDGQLRGREAAQRGAASINALDRGADYSFLKFPSSDEKIKTRLGADGVLAAFAGPERGPFGNRISRIALPAHWSRGVQGDPEARAVDRDSRGMMLDIGGRLFRYSRAGLQKAPD